MREAARNDLYVFSTRDITAMLYQTAGEIPSPRVGHASALVSNVLIVWGGDTKTDPMSKPTDKQDDALYLLNLGTCSITLIGNETLIQHSIAGVDSGWDLRTSPLGPLWSCCGHGWLKILYLWWAGRWAIPERHVGF